LSSVPHRIRTGHVIRSAGRLQPSRIAYSMSGTAPSQLARPRS
jgi:hypothetical protein